LWEYGGGKKELRSHRQEMGDALPNRNNNLFGPAQRLVTLKIRSSSSGKKFNTFRGELKRGGGKGRSFGGSNFILLTITEGPQ